MDGSLSENEQALQFRNKLLSVLSHNTKGLFANIYWLIEMIENNLADEAMLQAMLPELKTVAEKNLLDYTDTLTWIKTQQLEFKPVLANINVYALFEALHDFFAQQLLVKKQQLVFEGNRTVSVVSDAVLLQLILKKLLEIVLNFSYSEKGITFKISKLLDEKKISIEIENGCEKIIPENINNQKKALADLTDEYDAGVQFVNEIVAHLQGNLNITTLNESAINITLMLPFN